LEIVFPQLGDILPSAVGLEQYFASCGETISDNDLVASHYMYIPAISPTVCWCLA